MNKYGINLRHTRPSEFMCRLTNLKAKWIGLTPWMYSKPYSKLSAFFLKNRCHLLFHLLFHFSKKGEHATWLVVGYTDHIKVSTSPFFRCWIANHACIGKIRESVNCEERTTHYLMMMTIVMVMMTINLKIINNRLRLKKKKWISLFYNGSTH